MITDAWPGEGAGTLSDTVSDTLDFIHGHAARWEGYRLFVEVILR
jgi:hypothetical protein